MTICIVVMEVLCFYWLILVNSVQWKGMLVYMLCVHHDVQARLARCCGSWRKSITEVWVKDTDASAWNSAVKLWHGCSGRLGMWITKVCIYIWKGLSIEPGHNCGFSDLHNRGQTIIPRPFLKLKIIWTDGKTQIGLWVSRPLKWQTPWEIEMQCWLLTLHQSDMRMDAVSPVHKPRCRILTNDNSAVHFCKSKWKCNLYATWILSASLHNFRD